MSSLLSFNAALVADFRDAFDQSWKSAENHIFFCTDPSDTSCYFEVRADLVGYDIVRWSKGVHGTWLSTSTRNFQIIPKNLEFEATEGGQRRCSFSSCESESILM